MSENLIHINVAEEMAYLADYAGARCTDFQHQLINTRVDVTGPGAVTLFTLNSKVNPANGALIVTGLDIKTLYDPADIPLADGDFRSSFDLNPFGPFAAGAAVSQISISDNGIQQFETAWDIGLINAGVILVFSGGHSITIDITANQPAGAALSFVARLNSYLVPQEVGTELKKKQTRIITL